MKKCMNTLCKMDGTCTLKGRQNILGKHDQPAVCKMGRIQVPIKKQRKVSGFMWISKEMHWKISWD